MIVLSIDPGVHECATSTVVDEALRALDFVPWNGSPYTPTALGCMFGVGDLIIVERPEYQGARSDAAHAGNLIDLSWAGARLAYVTSGFTGARVIEYTPTQWKGSEAKPPQHLRLWEDCLSPAERKLFPPDTSKRITMAAEKYGKHPGRPGADYYGRGKGSEVHNLLDSTALGLAFVGRFR